MASKLRRSLPRPTVALRIEEEAVSKEVFSSEVHWLCQMAKAELTKDDSKVNEIVMRVINPVIATGDDYMVANCRLDDNAVTRVLSKVSCTNTRKPFERQSVVYSYSMDSLTMCVQKRSDGETRVTCHDVQCENLNIRGDIEVSIEYNAKTSRRPHSFPSRADVHSVSKAEVMDIDMSGAMIRVECFDDYNTISVIIRKSNDGIFHYTPICRAISCALEGRSGSAREASA